MGDLPLFGNPNVKFTRIENERVALMGALAEIAVEQKAISAKMHRLERELRRELEHIEEHWIPADQPLTQEDVQEWCRTAFYNLAHSMLSNPHCYYSRKKSRNPDMYERVVAYVLEHGYPQKYGSKFYTVLDVQLWGGVWFLWPMTDNPAESEVLNLKPGSLRPE